MADIIAWPTLLMPQAASINPVPFSRGGGRSISGMERTTRTDRGYWSVSYDGIPVHDRKRRRVWDGLRAGASGRTALFLLPAFYTGGSAPYASGKYEKPTSGISHSDGTLYSDGTGNAQGAISVEMATDAAVGATVVVLDLIQGAANLAGIRFSYSMALYETGPATSIEGNRWTVPVFPAIRRGIPAGSALECDLPSVLCRLASDSAMDSQVTRNAVDIVSVAFVEATDYWNDVAVDV